MGVFVEASVKATGRGEDPTIGNAEKSASGPVPPPGLTYRVYWT